MQKQILFFLMAMTITIVVPAQQTFFTAGSNKAGSAKKEISFSVAVNPDKNPAAFEVHVDNPANKTMNLVIRHEWNGVVIDTSFVNEQFNCRYNFELAEDGRYVVTLMSGKEKISRTVRINTVTRRDILVE